MTIESPAQPLVLPAARGGCPFSPPPAQQQAMAEEPVSRITLWDGSVCWMVTRHADVRAVLRDERFSADMQRPGFPFLTKGRRAAAGQSVSFVRMDDPEHARLRRMLTAEFMIKRTEALRPRIQEIVDDFLDRMLAKGGPADLVSEFALPIPSLVICMLLGVDYADHAFFQEHSRVLLRISSTAAEMEAARFELSRYLTELAARKRAEPDGAIISKLVARDELSDEEIAAMGLLLLIAGHETTANMTALSTLALLRDPEQLEKLRTRPELIKSAVEELLRFLSIVHSGVPRVATEDVEIGGQVVRAGEGVMCMINSANRDGSTFPEPDRLDLERPESRRHVAFGFGVHQCLGQPLARVELQIALETLLRRVPTLRLACAPEEIEYRGDMAVYGVHALPVTW